jgi:hypothetical protein
VEALIEGYKKVIEMLPVGDPSKKLPLEASDEEFEKATY